MKGFLPLLIALVVPVGVCADVFRPGPNQQLQLGERAAADLRKREKVLPASDARVRLVRRVGQRLKKVFSDPGKPWKFTFDVIDSKQVNAFSLPGGPSFIYTGLLSKLKTEDELAGIMGHEITHVRREHWAYAYAEGQKRQLGLTLALILLRANRTVGDVAGISNDLVFNLPYSRRHETEADEGGLKMMVSAGYNPEGMVDAFKMLAKEAGAGHPPEFLSDHPSDASRVKHMQEIIAGMDRDFPSQRPLEVKAAVEPEDFLAYRLEYYGLR
ncbi:MAG: M48 family metalloprotease [Fimbriimonas ginsengisoli]|uniref:M48 family metalloprotease n=1 Tax=Fimbriimonas ginsengisoli TaxID=1005039 RepID=A0A931LTN8_FIMGI|nr:M48 family metalloprotease [Fimbriimonas ginsengisoli]MBI3722090.1 M48 family metalloprotease [Fimbriimonas ginsengisoli]